MGKEKTMTRWTRFVNYKPHTEVMEKELNALKHDPARFAIDYCFTDHPTQGIRRFPVFPT